MHKNIKIVPMETMSLNEFLEKNDIHLKIIEISCDGLQKWKLFALKNSMYILKSHSYMNGSLCNENILELTDNSINNVIEFFCKEISGKIIYYKEVYKYKNVGLLKTTLEEKSRIRALKVPKLIMENDYRDNSFTFIEAKIEALNSVLPDEYSSIRAVVPVSKIREEILKLETKLRK